MTVYIHVPKKKKTKKVTFARSIVSHIEIDCKEQKAPKMIEEISLVQPLQIIMKS
jgi:hypothetical protein